MADEVSVREMAEVKTLLGVVKDSIDKLEQTITSNYMPKSEVEREFQSYDHRIKKLETIVWWMIGLGATVTITGGGWIFGMIIKSAFKG